ncbi:hypothetical protein PINS_up020395 [Pythium insidiosum]|nr:hypothetical protein PINS_up020395 [Pythium insidiosum]
MGTNDEMLYAPVKQDDLECHDGGGVASPRLFSRGPDHERAERRDIIKKILIGAFVVVPYILLLALYVGVGQHNSVASFDATTTGQVAELDTMCAAQRHEKLNTKRNVYYDSSLMTRPQRYAAVQQKGATLWFTGLSGSGKSTIGRALEKELLRRRIHVYRLDGDNVRIGLNRDLGFSETDRAESVRRVGEMSALFSEAGVITLVALVSPFRARRDEVRDLHQKMNIPFYEVFVDVPVSVAADRDVKGLYKRAIAGEIKDFTGVSSPYEAPLKPEVHLKTNNMTLARRS